MKKLFVPLLSLILLLLLPFAAYALDVRVLLGNYASKATLVISAGQYLLHDDTLNSDIGVMQSGETLNCSLDGAQIVLQANGVDVPIRTQAFTLIPTGSDAIITFNSQPYRDGFSLKYFADTSLNIINNVDMEHYLYGVVGREIGYGVPAEALKAQAVVSRTYAYANMNSAARYDVVATVNSQVYGGYAEESKPNAAAVRQAVDETSGIVLQYDGKCFPAYFSSNAGGHTENIENVWGGSSEVPFVGVESPYDDNGSSSYKWTVRYTRAELQSRANAYAGKDIGELKDIVISRLDSNGNPSVSGRVLKAEIIGTLGSVSATRDRIRTLLGLKSTLFDIKYEGSSAPIYLRNTVADEKAGSVSGLYAVTAAGKAMTIDSKEVTVLGAGGKRTVGQESIDTVVIDGKGYGHGVGLSQTGAIGMANAGYNYEQIVRHYFFSNDRFSLGNLYQ